MEPSPAEAADSLDPGALAVSAATVHQAQCSAVAAARTSTAAEAIEQVGPVLAEVSRGYESTAEPFLLYWRGLLLQCLGQDERAIADLSAFVADATGQPDYAQQVQESQRRLRSLTRSPAPPAVNPAAVLGAGLLGGGAALGGLSGWQAAELADAQARWDSGESPAAELPSIQADGDAAAAASNGLLVAAASTGVGGAVTLVIALVRGPASTPVVVVLPTPDGAVVSFGGRW